MAVNTRQSLSVLSSLMAFHSSFEMLGLDGLACFKILAMTALNSSASDGFRLWHATSTAVIYSLKGGLRSDCKIGSMCQNSFLGLR